MSEGSLSKPKTYCYLMYGLGGPIWSGGIENLLAANIRKLPNVICPPTTAHGNWRWIVEQIKQQPKGSKTVVIGHSMGAAAATYVTDYVYVDLIVCYDLAGQVPSKIGKNTGHAIDIYDVLPDMVPEWRVIPASDKYKDKIEVWTSRYGHTGQDDSVELMKKVVDRVKKLSVT